MSAHSLFQKCSHTLTWCPFIWLVKGPSTFPENLLTFGKIQIIAFGNCYFWHVSFYHPSKQGHKCFLFTIQGYEVVLVLQLTMEAVLQLFRDHFDLPYQAPHLFFSGYRNRSIFKGWNCSLTETSGNPVVHLTPHVIQRIYICNLQKS